MNENTQIQELVKEIESLKDTMAAMCGRMINMSIEIDTLKERTMYPRKGR